MSAVRDRYEWKRVEAPKTWRPDLPGEELCGFFGGKTLRNGSYGQYEVALLHVPQRGTFMVSGTRVIQLVDAAQIEKGWPIRIVWLGLVATGKERAMKDFAVYVAEEDERLAPEDLPELPPQRGRGDYR